MILAPVKLAYPSHLIWLATENEVLVYKSPICIFTFLKVLFSEQSYRFISETFSIEFSGLHYCLFVKVLCVLIWHNSITLSYVLKFVKNFFEIFLFLTTAAFAVGFHINMFFHFCQYVFLIYFYVVSAGRKKRILMLLRFLFYIS